MARAAEERHGNPLFRVDLVHSPDVVFLSTLHTYPHKEVVPF